MEISAADLYPSTAQPSVAEDFTFGSHLFLRCDQIDLQEILRRPTETPLRCIHIYCDSLVIPESLLSGDIAHIEVPQSLKAIFIFARDFLRSTPTLRKLLWGTAEADYEVFIFSEEVPVSLLIGVKDNGSSLALFHSYGDCPDNMLASEGDEGPRYEHQHIELDHSHAGCRIRVAKDGTPHLNGIANVATAEIEGPTAIDLETFGPEIRRTDNLSALLHMQFVSVSKADLLGKSTEILMSQLRFIIRCSRSSTSQVNLTTDAQLLLDRLELPQRFPGLAKEAGTRHFVPNLKAESYSGNLNKRIRNVERMSDSIDRFVVESENEAATRNMFSTILAEMGTNVEGFIDTEANLAKAIKAIADYEDKRVDMEKYVKQTKDASDRFQAGVVVYQKKKHDEFMMELYKAGGELAVSIIIAVATAGAGAPLTVGNLAKAQKAIKKGVSIGMKGKTAFKKIWDTVAKLGPKLMAATKIQSEFSISLPGVNNQKARSGAERRKDASGVLNKLANKATASSMPTSATATVDFLGILADWDEFNGQVDSMFTELQRDIGGDTIDGMPEYRLALKAQAIRGKTMLAAMRNSQDAVAFYSRQLVDVAAREARNEELQAMAEQAATTPQRQLVSRALRYDLSRDIIGVKRSLFVRFHQYLLALVYAANDSKKVAKLLLQSPRLSADLKVNEFMTLQTRLEEAMVDLKKQGQTIGQAIVVGTSANSDSIFMTDWKADLLSNHKVYFNIPWNKLKATQYYSRVRVHSFHARFVGLKNPTTDPEEHVEWSWELGPQFVDKSADGDPLEYYIPMPKLRQRGGEGNFINAEGDYIRPSLFFQGQIAFDKETNPNLDVREVSEIVLSFECEGVSI